jgi:ABC-2 type transport system ATP-binding protein
VIATEGLTKRFGQQTVVDAVDLDVPSGAVYGFLGPNGSGKTTTIRMLLGLVTPTSGSASVLGSAVPDGAGEVLPRVGALVEGPAFHPYLSGRDNLARLDAADRTVGRAGRAARIVAALDRVGLGAAAAKPYRAYSLGMRQRLGLAAALMRPRELLVLDEPTNGLDPQGTREVRHLVEEVARAGTTVFVSSHLLSEVEQMCSHVGVMRTGRLVAQGAIASLGDAMATRLRIVSPETGLAGHVIGSLGLPGITVAGADVTADLGDHRSEDVVEALVKAGVPVREVVVERPRLEDLFVSLTGEGFDVDE